MDAQELNNLKDWREKAGIPQTRFAELAKISLTTLRQFEAGTQKPQRKTLIKLTELMRSIEAGTLTIEEIHPPRKPRKNAKSAKVAVPASSDQPKRRGRPPRQSAEAAKAAPTPPQFSETTPAAVKPAVATVPAPSPVAPIGAGVVQLSNLDLELINRILNMSGKEKLALLSKLM